MDNILSTALATADMYTRSAEPFRILGFFIVMAAVLSAASVVIMYIAATLERPETDVNLQPGATPSQSSPLTDPVHQEPMALADLKNFSLGSSLGEENLDELHQYVKDDLELRKRGEVRIGGKRDTQ